MTLPAPAGSVDHSSEEQPDGKGLCESDNGGCLAPLPGRPARGTQVPVSGAPGTGRATCSEARLASLPTRAPNTASPAGTSPGSAEGMLTRTVKGILSVCSDTWQMLGQAPHAYGMSRTLCWGSECKASPSSLSGLKEFVPVPGLTQGHGVAGSGPPRAGHELKARQLLSGTWIAAEKLWM